MLRIDITGVGPNDELELEVGGRPTNGNTPAESGWVVNWHVRPNIPVDHIEAIRWKDISGSTDVFSFFGPPRAQDVAKKHWRGIINRFAPDYSVYVYSIDWVKEGSKEIKTFDPLMPIRPSTHFGHDIFNAVSKVVTVGAVALVAGFYISKLLSHKKEIKW